MTRKYKKASSILTRKLNIKLTMDVSDIKNTTQEIAMLGQYGLNIANLVEEAKLKSKEVSEGVKVRLNVERNAKGNISVTLRGIDCSYLIKSEMNEDENCITFKSIYNIARLLGGESISETELRDIRKAILGTIASMGLTVEDTE
jgi:ribosomal protein L11